MKSHLNDKPTCCLPLRPQSRHSDLWYFGAQLLSLQPCCLRLAHYITVTHSRLASNAVVSSLFDRISTCRIARPSLDALSGTHTSVYASTIERLRYFSFYSFFHVEIMIYNKSTINTCCRLVRPMCITMQISSLD